MKYPKWFERWWDYQSYPFDTFDHAYYVCRRIAWNAMRYGKRRATGGSARPSTQQAKVGTPQSVNVWRDVNTPMTARPTLCRDVGTNQ